MAEEISSDPESKTLGEGELGAIQQEAKTNDGVYDFIHGERGEDRWKRERWTRSESMALVSAMKQLEEDTSTTSSGGDAKWKSISNLCAKQEVERTSVQCRKRWNTLLAAYRKIKDWEKRNGLESYWVMGGLDCKAKKLPAGFDEEIWNVMNSFLAGRSGLSPRLFPYKTDDPPVDGVLAGAQQVDTVPVPQPLPQAVPQPLPQPLPPAVPEPSPQPLQQPLPQSLPQSFLEPAVQALQQTLPELPPHPVSQVFAQSVPQLVPPQPLPQPLHQRGRKEGAPPRKRKRAGRREIPIVAQEAPKPPKLDEQDAGTQRRGGFEALDPLTRFLSSFLEKSLEAYERNSELNRKMRREQGENLVAVLGSLSSAVRDLVQQK